MLRKITLGLAAVAIGIGGAIVWEQSITPASAQDYDDPAVAICEIVAQGSIPEGARYERLSSGVSANVATIRYQVSILNTRPQEKEHSCEFVRTEEGKFKLRPHTPARAECDAELAAYRQHRSRSAETALTECRDILERELRTMTRELTDREFPLIMTGIYPIEAEATDLRAVD